MFFLNFIITHGLSCFYHCPSNFIWKIGLDVWEVSWKMREIKKKFEKLWCGCGKTVKAVVRVRQNRAETQFCRNMEKNYTARRPAICLHAVIFWDFLSCGEACKSSHKFKKSQKMVTLANCGVGAAKQFKLWCRCGKTRKNSFLPKKKSKLIEK